MAHVRLAFHVILLMFAALLLAECSSDSIPSSPSGPFLFTQLKIGKDAVPAPGTFLTRGQNVVLHLNVSYTLTPEETAFRDSLALYIQAFGRDSTHALISVGSPRDSILLGSATKNILPDSLSISVPQNVVLVTVEAFIDSIPFTNPVAAIDTLAWPVH